MRRISRNEKAVRGSMRVNGRDIATLENADYSNVPGRSGIRIHGGTKPEHSKGCVLVNAAMEQELTAKWLALQASNEPIKIIIKNED